MYYMLDVVHKYELGWMLVCFYLRLDVAECGSNIFFIITTIINNNNNNIINITTNNIIIIRIRMVVCFD